MNIVDIVWMSLLYFLFCSVGSFLVNEAWCLTVSHPIKDMSTVGLLGQIAGRISTVAILFYIIRNVIHSIGSPFHRKGTDYDHQRAKEADGGVVAGFSLFLFCPTLLTMAAEIRYRL